MGVIQDVEDGLDRSVNRRERESTGSAPNWRHLYPFASHFATIDRHRMHYVDEPPKKGGDATTTDATFLMVHGNPTWSFYYRELIAAWRDRYRIVAPDHLGCGLSDKPNDYDYCLRRHADNLTALIELLDLKRITLFVHDWGGAIGLLASLACPERFQRFVIFNTGAFPPPKVPHRIAVCRTPFIGSLAVRGLNLFARAAQSMATARPRGLSKATLEGLIAPYNSWTNRVAIDAFVRDIPLTRRHRTHAELKALETQLRVGLTKPTQVIWGMRDWCFDSACLDKFREILPHAYIHRIADAGHWVVEDATDEIVRVVDDFFDATTDDVGHPVLRTISPSYVSKRQRATR